jgi:1-deoxy-D-xylulose-5-phosphate synthase
MTLSALRALPVEELPAACARVRRFVLSQTREKAGHLAASLGAAELTVALHYVLNTPEDVLLWDVGHQAYLHKIITDRAGTFATQRKPGGLSGFPKREESPFDAFGVGHSSTALSAALGFWRADVATGRRRQRVAVVGDGALTGGMSFEALNDGGGAGADVLLILNDNGLSIEPTAGALARGGASAYRQFFESLGWSYWDARLAETSSFPNSGIPVDGNDCPSVVAALRAALSQPGPRVLHVRTHRPDPAEWGSAEKPAPAAAFQSLFADALLAAAAADDRVVALTAAMAPGAGLDRFRAVHPDRTFDVGIAEQHAVTTAAALAAAGRKPVVSLYSTFFQRAVDQWIHDVALQNLPVVLCLDRAGWVGEDGPTHHGVFDVALLRSIPNTTVYAPRNGATLARMLRCALDSGTPTVLRYPRGLAPQDDGLVESEEGALLLQEAAASAHAASTHGATPQASAQNAVGPHAAFVPNAVNQSATASSIASKNILHWAAGTTASAVAQHCPHDAVWYVGRIQPLPVAALRAAAHENPGAEWHVWEDAQAVGGLCEGIAAWAALHFPGLRVVPHGYGPAFLPHGSGPAPLFGHLHDGRIAPEGA